MNTAVVHLVWFGSGLEKFKAFLESYRRYAAGRDHLLILAFRGFEGHEALLSTYLEAAGELEFHIEFLDDIGRDIFAYKTILDRLSPQIRKVLFLNSSSVFLAPGWLEIYENALATTNVGIVGATGSWERRLKSDPFPNTHLRTNAFFGDVSLLKKLNWGGPDDSLAFEAGSRSLHTQVRALGLEVVVVGRDGVCYPETKWIDAGTFRAHGQRNLLIGDNRTWDYERADEVKKMWLHILGWYEHEPGPNPDKRHRLSYRLKRLIYRLRWRGARLEDLKNEL